jgi:predicted nucleic acid-binding protein
VKGDGKWWFGGMDRISAGPACPAGPLCLAHETGLTFYVASYLRLGHEHGADLVSLDAQLVRIARRFGTTAPTPHITRRSRN